MIRYVARRIVYMFIALFIIVSITFLISKALPADPFSDPKLTPQVREQPLREIRPDEPLYVQYAKHMAQVAQGDLGNSYSTRRATCVGDDPAASADIRFYRDSGRHLRARHRDGAWHCRRPVAQHSMITSLAVVVAILGVSVPSFVLAPVLQYWFGLKLGWFPEQLISRVGFTCFAFAGALGLRCLDGRPLYGTEMLEVIGQDYITLARSKGLSGLAVIPKHVIRNAMIPLVTVMALLTIYIITGALVIEQIFVVPGVGELAPVQSVVVNDYSVILGTTIFFSVLFILALLIQDIHNKVIDPRTSRERRSRTWKPDIASSTRVSSRKSRIRPGRRGIVKPSVGFWKDAWRRLKKNRGHHKPRRPGRGFAMAFVIGPLVAQHSPYGQNMSQRYWGRRVTTGSAPTSSDGTCGRGCGRGTRVSLYTGLLAALLDIFRGVVYGAFRFSGGRTDDLMYRDYLNGVPYLIVAILMMVVFCLASSPFLLRSVSRSKCTWRGLFGAGCCN